MLRLEWLQSAVQAPGSRTHNVLRLGRFELDQVLDGDRVGPEQPELAVHQEPDCAGLRNTRGDQGRAKPR